MEQICDLHVHSNFSDGTLKPAQLIELAKKNKVRAVALCDHNTVAGLREFLAAAEGSGVKAVPGIEFSTEYDGAELHILGLFLAHHAFDPVTARLEQLLQRKEQSNRALIESLKGVGIALDYDSIKAGTAGGSVNRAVIAAEMKRLGYCTSVQEAFSRWLSKECGHYRPPRRPDALETVRFIKSIGAVAVLAHPFLSLQEQALRTFLAEAAPSGLDAMEVYYSTFSPEQTALAEKIAREFGLLPSGGSDFHGANKPDIALGAGRGNLRIPYFVLENLARRATS